MASALRILAACAVHWASAQTPTARLSTSRTPSPTGAPSIVPLVLNAPLFAEGLVEGAVNWYSFALSSLAAAPWGFTVRVIPTAGDPDLALSTTPPPPGARRLTPTLASREGGLRVEAIDGPSQSVVALPAGGPYFVEVLGYTSVTAYSIVVVPLGQPSLSASSVATITPTRSAPPLPTAVTPIPSPGTILPLRLNETVYFAGLRGTSFVGYSLDVPRGAALNGLRFVLQSAPDGNSALHVQTSPPTVLLRSEMVGNAPISITVLPNDPIWGFAEDPPPCG